MRKGTLIKMLCALIASIPLVCLPTLVLAQHGGHGGGGGFHGGGGGGFHGGSGFYGGGHSYGGYHGGGYGWHGGYGGWHGGYWGYPRYGYGYGYGWGFSIGFGWGSYWPGYPYAYGYSPWWATPYYYPYAYGPYGYPYSYPYNGYGNVPGSNSYGNSPANSPAPRDMNSAAMNVALSASKGSNHTTDAPAGTANNYVLASSSTQQSPSRREVQNVIQALRAMPPDARRRQLDSGRYSAFSPEERSLLDNASQPSLALRKAPVSTPRPPS
jgi:hypothetical protein